MILTLEKENFEKSLFAKSDLIFSDRNPLSESILYSLKAPAKRIRPLLCLGFSRGFGGNERMGIACGIGVEMIHTYSLIHDDLPSMDDDDYRRGQLTNHKVYGEAIAILAGDSLLSSAPEFLMQELKHLGMDAEKIISLCGLLLAAAGPKGMVLGQAMDMQNEKRINTITDKDELERILHSIHSLKTGSIIKWSCLAGLYTHPDKELIQKHQPAVEKVGDSIGLLFQMIDDVLDVTSTLQEMGKTPGKDMQVNKLSYTNLHGLKQTRELSLELIKDIRLQMKDFGNGNWEIVSEIINSLETKIISAAT